MSTILKSLAVCVVLLGAWHLCVNRLPTKYRVGGNAGSQYEQNVMRGQAFVYGRSQPRIVVVGSSIANRLRDLPRDWFNLSFNGGSAFTGLEMIVRSGRVPKVVLIETNMLIMDADERQLRELFTPGLYQARRRLAFLAETNKPHLVAQRAFIEDDDKPATREQSPVQTASAATAPTGIIDTRNEPDVVTTVLSPEQFTMLETRRAGELAEPIKPKDLDHMVATLQRYIRELERRGARVVLFEMPEYADFAEKPRPASVRTKLREAFPDRWAPPVDPSLYHTTDFVHLTAHGSRRYADVLEGHVAAIAPVPTTQPQAPVSAARHAEASAAN